MDKKELSYKVGKIIDTKIESIKEDTAIITEALINIRASVDELSLLDLLHDDIKKI